MYTQGNLEASYSRASAYLLLVLLLFFPPCLLLPPLPRVAHVTLSPGRMLRCLTLRTGRFLPGSGMHKETVASRYSGGILYSLFPTRDGLPADSHPLRNEQLYNVQLLTRHPVCYTFSSAMVWQSVIHSRGRTGVRRFDSRITCFVPVVSVACLLGTVSYLLLQFFLHFQHMLVLLL